jgi:hypothetical protein
MKLNAWSLSHKNQWIARLSVRSVWCGWQIGPLCRHEIFHHSDGAGSTPSGSRWSARRIAQKAVWVVYEPRQMAILIFIFWYGPFNFLILILLVHFFCAHFITTSHTVFACCQRPYPANKPPHVLPSLEVHKQNTTLPNWDAMSLTSQCQYALCGVVVVSVVNAMNLADVLAARGWPCLTVRTMVALQLIQGGQFVMRSMPENGHDKKMYAWDCQKVPLLMMCQ